MPTPHTITPEEAIEKNSLSFFIPAKQAEEVAQRQKMLNSAKRPAYIPKAIKDQSEKGRLFIFNVGPKMLEGSGASYGVMMIPQCFPDSPEGREQVELIEKNTGAKYRGKLGEYSAPLVVPGLPHEYYNKEGSTLDVQFHGEGEMDDPGYDFACQVIGGYTDHKGQWNGKMLSRNNSLERYGVGISRVWPPAKEDVALARRKLLAEYGKLVQQANEAHAIGKFSAVSTPDHYIAARALGKTAQECRWLEMSAEVETRQVCPKCRKPYDAGTVEHDCGFILDKKQYDEWVKEGRIAK